MPATNLIDKAKYRESQRTDQSKTKQGFYRLFLLSGLFGGGGGSSSSKYTWLKAESPPAPLKSLSLPEIESDNDDISRGGVVDQKMRRYVSAVRTIMDKQPPLYVISARRDPGTKSTSEITAIRMKPLDDNAVLWQGDT